MQKDVLSTPLKTSCLACVLILFPPFAFCLIILKLRLLLKDNRMNIMKKNLVLQLLFFCEPFLTECPSVQEKLSSMHGCQFDDTCMTFSCCAGLTYLKFKHSYLVSVDLNPCTGLVTLAVNDWTRHVNVKEQGFGNVVMFLKVL